MKVGILTDSNPRVKFSWLGSSWSGLHYYMTKSLEDKGIEIVYLGPVYLTRILVGLTKILNEKILRKFLSKNIDIRHSIFIAKVYAFYFNKRLKSKELDLIFCPSFSMGLAYLNTNKPIIYYSDVTFELLNGYYENFSNFYDSYVYNANKLEKIAFNKSDKVLFASSWAANSALEYYSIPREKIGVIPFGGNLDKIPERNKVLDKKNKIGVVCKLLFIGVDWKRKGGEIAYNTLVELINMNIDAELTIIGCVPPKGFSHPNLKVIPFLDKGNPKDYMVFESLLLESHIFILPTRAECFGLVFCEANAFGLPVVATNTGGIPTAVIEGKNGYLMDLSDNGAIYAKKIKEVFSNKEKFTHLISTSRDEFEKRLNWEKWSENMLSIFEEKMNEH